MKRLIAIFLACCMLLSMCACAPEGISLDAVKDKLPTDLSLNSLLPDALLTKDMIPEPVQMVLDILMPVVDKFDPGPGTEDLYDADYPGNLTMWDRPMPTPTPTPVPTPTPSPTPAPPRYENPLNGEPLQEPYTGRVFASTISNVMNAVPHNGLNEADVVYEMYVNGSVVRLLALFTDIASVEAFGGVRSTRPMFHDIVQHFNAVLLHSGGATSVLSQLNSLPINAYNIDSWDLRQSDTSFRKTGTGLAYENTLNGKGANIYNYVKDQGVEVTQPVDKDYGLEFADEGTPAGGSTANEIHIVFKFNQSSKETIMKYDAELDKYVFWQYVKEMKDLTTGEKEAFKNIIVMNTQVSAPSGYHHADFNAGGDGYFACGGQIIPIKWTCAGQDQPFKYTLEDGTPLQLERGNTYIAIAPVGSNISWS